MQIPTQDAVLAAGRHVITFAGGGVTMFAALHLITGGDADSAAKALNQIGHGFSEIVAGGGTLLAIVSGTLAALSANPLLQLIKEKNTKQDKPPAVRADLRFGLGPDGQILVLNKGDRPPL